MNRVFFAFGLLGFGYAAYLMGYQAGLKSAPEYVAHEIAAEAEIQAWLAEIEAEADAIPSDRDALCERMFDNMADILLAESRDHEIDRSDPR